HPVPAGGLGHRRGARRRVPRGRGGGPAGGGRSASQYVTGAGQAVVVGATGTIGQAVIRRLTRRGLPVLAVARGQDDLAKLASTDELVTPCPADIGSNDAIGAIGSALTGLEGPVRMAVFAAGLPDRGGGRRRAGRRRGRRLAGVRVAELAGPAADRGRAGLGGGDAARPGGRDIARQRALPGRGRPPRDSLIAGGGTGARPVRSYS